MKVLTIQSEMLDVAGKIYADPKRCSHPNALPVYHRLFKDYNSTKGTHYESFFWGFSKLCTDDLDKAVIRACEMIGLEEDTGQVLILDVPDEICLETDFYNFSDEIYAFLYPKELESCWISIYENRESERQVIFPCIAPNMIIRSFRLPHKNDE